jgi:hypothetical protein
VCYVLHVAGPLTLSEIRSMLPPGLSADYLTRAEGAPLQQLHPDAQTVARLLRGACSCDLVLERDPLRHEEERHLRARYARLGLSRERVIAALERHRRGGAARPRPRAHWTRALAGFVAEHARNAGPTLYHLHFSPYLDLHDVADTPPRPLPLARVRENPDGWLVEGVPLLVSREGTNG